MRRQDGKIALVEIAASSVRNGGEQTGVYFARDVTELALRDEERRAEEAVSLALAQAASVDDLVLHGIEAARPRAEAHGVSLSCDTEAITIAAGDADRAGQLVDNLISNAIKFTPEGGTVVVNLWRQDGNAVMEVRDSGPGIPRADQPHLFERFYRTEDARRGAVPGLGLGLSISRAIVEGHGGGISVESELGGGSTFRVELPVGA